MADNAAVVKSLREGTGLSQQKLADLAGVSRGIIAHVENGRTDFSEETMNKISRVLAERLDLAYVAGLFDRRSVIRILKTNPEPANKHKGNSRKSVHYTVRVEFRSKHKILAETIHKVFNVGSLTRYKIKNIKGEISYGWTYMAWSRNGGEVLEKLQPYLRLKRPQVELLLQLRELQETKRHNKDGDACYVNCYGNVRQKPLTPGELAKMEDIYLKVKALNKAL